MSETVQHVGTIKELYPEQDTMRDKLICLAKSLGIQLSELVVEEDIEEYVDFNQAYWGDYVDINGRLFDITDASRDDIGEGDMQEIMKIAPGTYKIAMRFYTGGTCLEEMVEEVIEKADKEYDEKVNHKLYYAVKFKDGGYLTNATGGIAPALYTTPAKAKATADMRISRGLFRGYLQPIGTDYDVVPFKET